ncbi:hypothetical protein ACP70R_020166 [Stipagrostis hirtigluma subsp. patula]
MAAAAEQEKELLSSVVGEIRCYAGSDPLRPWLRGMRRMERALLPATLQEKLPRFLQKCAQEFEDDARYRDDPRYLRVWIQLMDYVKDAKPLLKKMEKNGIGLKRASFYMAYAIYYEKHKRFDQAEKMYRLGIHKPISELHKAHEQFTLRMKVHKRRKDKLQETMATKAGSSATCMNQVGGESRNCKDLKSNTMQKSGGSSNSSLGCYPPLPPAKVGMLSRGNSGVNKNLSRCNSDDTVVVRFVGSAFVGKSETEDACHHGLVEPTINTKEAMDAINSMFLEPLEPETMLKRRSKHEKPNYDQQTSAFGIFVDEDGPHGNDPNKLHNYSKKQDPPNFIQQNGGFEIFVDEDGPNSNKQIAGQSRDSNKENMNLNQKPCGFEIFVDESEANEPAPNAMCHKNNRCPPRPLCDSSRQKRECDFQKPFIGGFAILADDEDEQCEKNDDGVQMDARSVQSTYDKNTSLCPEQAISETKYCEGSHPQISGLLREDSVIHRFVGSTVVGEPKVENSCHHGLVDPTVNLKEAMEEINDMFGRPLNFNDGKRNNRKTSALSERKAAPVSGFSILADDDLKENPAGKGSQSNSCSFGAEDGLFEPTITTRDVMAEINGMFGMPLDF